MSERELLPCPFCRSETGAMMKANRTWRVWCLRPASVCGYIGPDKETEAEAIAHHNRARQSILEEAAKLIEEKHTNNVGMVHPMALDDAKAIRSLAHKENGDE